MRSFRQVQHMSSQLRDDADYPYSPRPAPVSSDNPSPKWRSTAWRRMWLWMRRGFAVAGVLCLLVIIVGSYLTYRAGRQAWAISYLEQRQAHVVYWQPLSIAQGELPDFLGD